MNVQIVFLMMNTCSKHVEDAKKLIKTLLSKKCAFGWFTVHKCITMQGINNVKSRCNPLYPPLDMDNKTKTQIIKATSVVSVCLRSHSSWTNCSNKMCLVWLMFRCCFKTSRFGNRMLQSNFVWRVNSGSAMFLANEGTSLDLWLLQWRWCISSLLVWDYLKMYVYGIIFWISQEALLLYVNGRYTSYVTQSERSNFILYSVILCVCVFVCVYEKKEMVKISTIYHNISYKRMYLAWRQGQLGCGVF